MYNSEIVNNKKVPRKGLLLRIAQVLDVDVRELFVSTKEKDLSDPLEAIKEIKKIVDRVERTWWYRTRSMLVYDEGNTGDKKGPHWKNSAEAH